VQHPKRAPLYWVHLCWVLYMFLTAVFWWWWEFRFHSVEVWTLQLYLFVLGYAFLIYLVCALLFPADLEGYEDYRSYFYSRRAWFFGLQAAGLAVDLGDTLAKAQPILRASGSNTRSQRSRRSLCASWPRSRATSASTAASS